MVLPLNYLAAVFLSLIFTVIQFTWELEVDDGTLLIFCLLINFFSAIVVGLLVVFVLRIDVSRDAQEGNNTFESKYRPLYIGYLKQSGHTNELTQPLI